MEKNIKLSQLIKDRAAYRFMEELGTKPRGVLPATKDRGSSVERGYENLDSNLKKRFEYIMSRKKREQN